MIKEHIKQPSAWSLSLAVSESCLIASPCSLRQFACNGILFRGLAAQQAPKQSMNNFPTDAVYELKQMASLFLFFLTSIIFSYITMNIYSPVAVHKNGEQEDLDIVLYVSAVLMGFGWLALIMFSWWTEKRMQTVVQSFSFTVLAWWALMECWLYLLHIYEILTHPNNPYWSVAVSSLYFFWVISNTWLLQRLWH